MDKNYVLKFNEPNRLSRLYLKQENFKPKIVYCNELQCDVLIQQDEIGIYYEELSKDHIAKFKIWESEYHFVSWETFKNWNYCKRCKTYVEESQCICYAR